ncbi:MAG: hypothetical protein ABIS86_18520, partial [Streptosporangiaceae bacterium]
MRDDDAANTDDAYWRRRAIALCVVVTAVGLTAWACSGDGGPAEQTPVKNAAAVASLTPTPKAAKPPVPGVE